jgi:hypothetical protein
VTELATWNVALLDTLLPGVGNTGRGVLLACDDDAVVAAGARLDIPRKRAIEEFIEAIRTNYRVSTALGLSVAAEQLAPFARQPRPRAGPPPFFAALCLTVLAASHMTRDERLSTGAYYQRLCDLLRIEPLDGWPAVAGFEDLVRKGMRSLADWLSDDEGGVRGSLLLPARPKPSLVGFPISQTLLRGRDRELLGVFFAAHARHLRAGYDPALLLRRWSGRERLTRPAQNVLADPQLAEALGAAIRTAFAAWDGSFVDSTTGRRVLPGSLRLVAAPGRIGLRLAVPALSEAATASTTNGETIPLRAYPDAAGIPHSVLNLACEGPVRLALHAREEEVAAIPGKTALFELGAGGLEQIPAAGEEPVWVLTSDPVLLSAIPEGPRHFRAPLPSGWALLADVKPEELPEDMRVSERDGAPVLGATLAGGLQLDAWAWLVDYPPRVHCDLPEPAPVMIDDVDHGYMEPGEALTLGVLAGDSGTHRVEVAGLYELEFELRESGSRDGIGTVGRYPQDPRLLRAGPMSAKDAGEFTGARIAGACIAGGPELRWRPPLMVTFSSTVHVIYRDGRVRACSPPNPPVWLTQVGLDRAVNRWEIPDGADAVWLCVASDSHPRVLARLEIDIPVTNEALDLVDWFAERQVVGDDATRRRWRRLVAIAHEDEAPVDAT